MTREREGKSERERETRKMRWREGGKGIVTEEKKRMDESSFA